MNECSVLSWVLRGPAQLPGINALKLDRNLSSRASTGRHVVPCVAARYEVILAQVGRDIVKADYERPGAAHILAFSSFNLILLTNVNGKFEDLPLDRLVLETRCRPCAVRRGGHRGYPVAVALERLDAQARGCIPDLNRRRQIPCEPSACRGRVRWLSLLVVH